MMSLLKNLFYNHWERKVISLFLGVVIWLIVNHALTATKVLDDVAVRLINIPSGMTVEGLQSNGMLSKKVTVSLMGNKNLLDEMTANDVEIVLDAVDKSGEWLATVSKKNLNSLNPDIDLSKSIKRVLIQRVPIQFTRLVTEKIPVIVTHPIGEAPRDYQFLDVWPYRLTMTVSGPEETIKQLKTKVLKLTFNLNNISHSDLDAQGNRADEVSFFVPAHWKQLEIPSLSDRPFTIDDPAAKELRLDFVRNDLHPVSKSLPISLYFPHEHQLVLNPETLTMALTGIVQQYHGINTIRKLVYAKGVSRKFVELVQDMIEISIIVAPRSEKKQLDWSVQFLNPRVLEDKYVSELMSEEQYQSEDPNFARRHEEYLRNRFRSYMNRFQLYISNREKFEIRPEIEGNQVVVHENETSSHY